MPHKDHSVHRHPFFHDLPAEHLDVVMRIVETKKFSAGAALFVQGDPARSVYFIVEGRALLKARLPGGGEVELTTLDKGELLGELALMQNHRRSVSAIADGELTALCMDSTDLSALYAHYHPASLLIMHRLAVTLAQRFRDTNPGAAHIRAGEWCSSPQPGGSVIVQDAEFDFLPFLPALTFFEHFSGTDIAAMIAMGGAITVPKNGLIRGPDDDDRNCYVVIRGAVEIRLGGAEDCYQTEVLGPGSTFGESNWLLDQATSSVARSLSRATLLVLSGSCRKLLKDPERHLSFRFYEGLVHSLLSKLDTQTRGYARRQQSILID